MSERGVIGSARLAKSAHLSLASIAPSRRSTQSSSCACAPAKAEKPPLPLPIGGKFGSIAETVASSCGATPVHAARPFISSGARPLSSRLDHREDNLQPRRSGTSLHPACDSETPAAAGPPQSQTRPSAAAANCQSAGLIAAIACAAAGTGCRYGHGPVAICPLPARSLLV